MVSPLRQKRQTYKNEAANGGENQHKTAGHGRTLRKLLFITKAEFFLFSGFREIHWRRRLFYPVLPGCHDKP